MALAWRNFTDAVFEHAATHPAAPALIAPDGPLSYERFADLLGKAAVYMDERGIEPGEVVGLGLPLGGDHLLLSLALLRIGAVPLALPRLPPAALRVLTETMHIREVFAAAPPRGAPAMPEGWHPIDSDWWRGLDGRSGDRRVARDPEETHFLELAAAPHGQPAVIAANQRQFLARIDATRDLLPEAFPAERPGRLRPLGGFGHAAAFQLVATQLSIGGAVAFDPPDVPAEQAAGALAAEPDTVCLMPAATCRRLLALDPVKQASPARAVLVPAGTLRPTERQEFTQRLGVPLCELYAAPGCGVVAASVITGSADRPNGLARFAPGLRVEAVDGTGKSVAVGRLGHLRISGPGIAPAGRGTPGEWRLPGELGSLDIAGCLTLRGHASQLLHRRGVDVFLPSVEQALRRHPGLLEAAVIVAPAGPEGEPRLLALGVPRNGADLATLARETLSGIEAAARPDQLIFVRALPRRPDRGLDRRRLFALAQRALAHAGDAGRAAPADAANSAPKMRVAGS